MNHERVDRVEIVDALHHGVETEHDGQSRPLTVEIVRDTEAFAALRDSWNAIVEASSATVFQTFEWAFLWWKHFGMGQNRTLHILVFRCDEQVVGIAPLYLDVCSLGGIRLYRRLRLLGCGVTQREPGGTWAEYDPSDYLDILGLLEWASEVAHSLAWYLRHSAFLCDEVTFTSVPQESLILQRFIPQLSHSGVHYTIGRADICPRLRVPSSIEDFIRGRPSEVRHRWHQTRKAFSGTSPYSIETIHSAASLSGGFRDLVTLHQQRWNRMGYPGMFCHSRFQRFQEDIARCFGERGWLWFKIASLNGTRIAARLGFKFKDRFYDYLSGFDDRSPGTKRRPGLALLLSMIEDAVQCNIHEVDLLRGNEPYKFELTSEFAYTWNISIPNRETRRTFRVRAYRMVQWGEWIWCRLSKEWTLLRVHYHVYGVAMFLSRYLMFRVSRIIQHAMAGRCSVPR